MNTPQSGQATDIPDPQKPLQPPPVEADNNLVIYHDDRYRHPPRAGDQLAARRPVLGDILRHELHTVRRKELFRRMAGLSG